jgi:hypothetical protein
MRVRRPAPGGRSQAADAAIASDRGTTCVEIDIVDETTLAVRGLGQQWESIKRAARAVERVEAWDATGTIFRLELQGGHTRYYLVFESAG